MSVLVLIEQRGGKPSRLSLEAIAAAKVVAQAQNTTLRAVIPGADSPAAAAEIARYPVESVLMVTSDALQAYTPDGYTAALEQVIRAQEASAIVFPHTYEVRDYAPKLASRFGHVLVSDVVGIKTEGGLTLVRQLFQGKLNADVMASGAPIFLSVQAGAFRAPEVSGQSAPVESFAVQIDAAQVRSRPEPPFQEAQRSVDLSAADYIVSVGRGIREQDKLPVVEALARVLGAELAASRPICDNGWLPMERQVGSSGQTVAPKMYVAVGVSGAIQHLVGMKGSKTVVAINRDENAPIFEIADYGIVGDLFEVVPALVEEIKKAKG
jgi:electron transfer flavoprotein alpha subunit